MLFLYFRCVNDGPISEGFAAAIRESEGPRAECLAKPRAMENSKASCFGAGVSATSPPAAFLGDAMRLPLPLVLKLRSAIVDGLGLDTIMEWDKADFSDIVRVTLKIVMDKENCLEITRVETTMHVDNKHGVSVSVDADTRKVNVRVPPGATSPSAGLVLNVERLSIAAGTTVLLETVALVRAIKDIIPSLKPSTSEEIMTAMADVESKELSGE